MSDFVISITEYPCKNVTGHTNYNNMNVVEDQNCLGLKDTLRLWVDRHEPIEFSEFNKFLAKLP